MHLSDLQSWQQIMLSNQPEGKKITLGYSENPAAGVSVSKYKKISFACDAGMGSSALGASAFKKRLKDHDIKDIEVKHYRIEDVPKDSDAVVIQV